MRDNIHNNISPLEGPEDERAADNFFNYSFDSD